MSETALNDQMRLCPEQSGISCIPGPGPDGRCCRVTPAAPVDGLSIVRRNPHHWDVYTKAGRAFAIRGEPGGVFVRDERYDASRPFPRPHVLFRSVAAATSWCLEELMHE